MADDEGVGSERTRWLAETALEREDGEVEAIREAAWTGGGGSARSPWQHSLGRKHRLGARLRAAAPPSQLDGSTFILFTPHSDSTVIQPMLLSSGLRFRDVK